MNTGDVKVRVYDAGDGHEKLVPLDEFMARSDLGAAYDISQFTTGAPGSSAVVFAYVATRAMTFPINFTASQMVAKTAATASTIFTLKKNGSTIGTATFAIAGTVPTFSVVAVTTLAAGDLLEITAPASADGTLASLRTTLVATLA